MGHHGWFSPQGIFVHHGIIRPLIRERQVLIGLVQALFHRVEGYGLAGPHAHGDQLCCRAIQGAFNRDDSRGECKKAGQAHPVLGNGTCFVHTDDRGAAQAFHCFDLFDQDAFFHQAPGTQGHKCGKGNRDFLRQDAHGQRKGLQQAVNGVEGFKIIDAPNQQEGDPSPDRHLSDKICNLTFQRGFPFLNGLQALADLTQLRGSADRGNCGYGQAAGNHGAFINEFVRAVHILENGEGFSGQQGFVDREVIGVHNGSISLYDVALLNHQFIARDQFFAFNLNDFPTADDPAARLGKFF